MKKRTKAKKTSASAKTKPSSKKATPQRVRRAARKVAPTQPEPEKRSFWSFLGVGRKPKAKVGLMEVRSK